MKFCMSNHLEFQRTGFKEWVYQGHLASVQLGGCLIRTLSLPLKIVLYPLQTQNLLCNLSPAMHLLTWLHLLTCIFYKNYSKNKTFLL